MTMVLTPMEIHNKEFPRKMRGYSENEVDKFLDQVVEEFERLYKENIDMRERISLLNDQINHYKSMERTLNETLITAQKTADDVVVNAQKKSENIEHNAEEQAKRIIDVANSDVIRIRREYEEVKKQMQIFKTRFKSILETQIEILTDHMNDSHEE